MESGQGPVSHTICTQHAQQDGQSNSFDIGRLLPRCALICTLKALKTGKPLQMMGNGNTENWAKRQYAEGKRKDEVREFRRGRLCGVTLTYGEHKKELCQRRRSYVEFYRIKNF